MEKTIIKRSARLPFVRLTPAEKEQIKMDYLASPFTSQSAYMRYKLLESGSAQTAKKEMEVVLKLGAIADEMKVLSKHFVQLVRLRKQEIAGKLLPEELEQLAQISKSIQQINTQFDKNESS